MEIFGIGLPELLLIIAIALIVLGPKDMVKNGQKIGRAIRNIIRSPTWAAMMSTSREIRELPTKLVREAGLEEEVAEIKEMRENLQVRNAATRFLTETEKPVTVDVNPEEEVKPFIETAMGDDAIEADQPGSAAEPVE